MDDPNKTKHRRLKTPAERQAQAGRLVRHLESQIAATADQRAVVLKAFEHPIAAEPHRDHHAYHLGADLFYCGLATGDGTAMMGLMSMGPAHVGQMLLDAAAATPNVYVARLWSGLIDANRDEYEARGRFVQWQRRWARYKTEHDGWIERAASADNDTWRERHMTCPQRHLVQDCAILLDIDIPEAMTRGQAHDWLMQNGANVVYRKEV